MTPSNGGFVSRDLNKNGRLDPYEDPRRPIDERVEDLLSQMTLEEKAGLLFHTFIPADPGDTALDGPGVSELLHGQHMTHFNLHRLPPPRLAAVWHNRLQKLAEESRLGIPERIPAVVVIHLDRPAVIPEIAARSAALLGDFGASDAAVLDVIFGRFAPAGRLPFEMPSSMESVRRQKPDVPHDSGTPLFAYGHGLSY